MEKSVWELRINYGDLDESNLNDTCPNCGAYYDDFDFEFQICHFCKYDNS